MKKIEVYSVIVIFFLSLLACLLQFGGLEKTLVIDLSDDRRVSVRDDRVFSGTSTVQYQKVKEG